LFFILATPYDDKKESKEAREKKQSQLKKIEEAKKREKGVAYHYQCGN